MHSPADFVTWALDPARTIEEAYFIERLVEVGVKLWEGKHPDPTRRVESFDIRYRRERRLKERRRLNPAHRVRPRPAEVEQTAEMLPGLAALEFDCSSDRPLRVLGGLRFLPALRTLKLRQTEITDLTPVAALEELEVFHLWDAEAADLRPVMHCRKLKELDAWLEEPWPQIDGLGELAALEVFIWRANLLALTEVRELPAVRRADLGSFQATLPPRSCRELPAMPQLTMASCERVHDLAGIERSPRLLSLKLQGTFRDLGPLRALLRLTHLEINAPRVLDLSPLAALPELRSVTVHGPEPRDFSPLVEAPRLHEIKAPQNKINAVELASVRAVLAPWAEEFAVSPPRPLAPLRLVACASDRVWQKMDEQEQRDDNWTHDPALTQSLRDWRDAQVQARLDALFGGKHWGCYRWHVCLQTLPAARRLPEVLETLRGLLAELRRPWRLPIRVDLDPPEDDDDELERPLSEEDEVRQELEDHRHYRRQEAQRQAFLERQHRLRLIQQESGGEVKPEEFEAAPEELLTEGEPGEAEAAAAARAEEEEEEDSATPEAPAGVGFDPEKEVDQVASLARHLDLFGVLSETTFRVDAADRDAVVHLLEREPEEE